MVLYLDINMLNEKELNNFMDKIYVCDGCWHWLGNSLPSGYGRVSISRLYSSPQNAHRVAYSHFVGDIGDTCVCHTCDNPGCVNPDHLFLGTHKENMRDRDNKGRCFLGRGENHPFAKLTEQDVLRIRDIYQYKTNAEIAKEYNVSTAVISQINRRETWKHI